MINSTRDSYLSRPLTRESAVMREGKVRRNLEQITLTQISYRKLNSSVTVSLLFGRNTAPDYLVQGQKLIGPTIRELRIFLLTCSTFFALLINPDIFNDSAFNL